MITYQNELLNDRVQVYIQTNSTCLYSRKQAVLPTIISLVVSYMSALLIIGATAEVYNWGIHMAIVVSISYGLAMFIAERLVVPWLYPLKLVSVFEVGSS